MSLEKVLLPTYNSTWGVHVRPVSTNLYKFAYDFDNLQDKEDFVVQELFDLKPPSKLSDLFKKQPSVRWTRKSDLKAEVKIDKRNYDAKYDDNWFLNKDIIILYNEKDQQIKYFFYAITNPRKINDYIFSYDCELDVFFTYGHLDYINSKSYLRVEQAHFNNWIDHGTGGIVPNIKYDNQNELFSKESFNINTEQLVKVNSYDFNENLDELDWNISFDRTTMTDELIERFYKALHQCYWRIVYFSEDIGTRKVWGLDDNETSKWISPWSDDDQIVLASFQAKLNYYLLATPQNIFYDEDPLFTNKDVVRFTFVWEGNTGAKVIQNISGGFYNYVNLLLSANYESTALSKQAGVISQAIIHNACYDLPIIHFFNYLKNRNIQIVVKALQDQGGNDAYIFNFEMNYIKQSKTKKSTHDWLCLENNVDFLIYANNIIDWDFQNKQFNPNTPVFTLSGVDFSKICNVLNKDVTAGFIRKQEPKMLMSPFTSIKLESFYAEYEYFLNNFNYSFNVKNGLIYLDFNFSLLHDWQIANKGYYIFNTDSLSQKLVTKMHYYNGAQNYLPTYNNAYTSWAVDNYNQYTTSMNQAQTKKKEAEANSGLDFFGAVGDALSGNFGGAVNQINSGVQGAVNAGFEVQKLQASLADKKNAPTTIQPTTSKEYNNMILNNFSEQLNIYTLSQWNFEKINWYFHKYGIKSGNNYQWNRDKLQRSRYWWNYLETENLYEAVSLKVLKNDGLSANIKQIIAESYENGITFFHVRRDKQTNKLQFAEIKDYDHNNVPMDFVN